MLLALMACSSAPPHQGHVERWFDALVDGDDHAAWVRLEEVFHPPEWDEEHFSLRIDRLGMRSEAVDVEVEVRNATPPPNEGIAHRLNRWAVNRQGVADVTATLENGKKVTLVVQKNGDVSEVTLGASTTLIPVERYHVIPLPPPLDEPLPLSEVSARIDDRGRLWMTARPNVSGGSASFLVDTRCLLDERWMRHATQSTRQLVQPSIELSSSIGGLSPLCSIQLVMGQEDGRRVGDYCLRSGRLTAGACSETPTVREGIGVLDVEVDAGEHGGSVHYTLWAEALPEPYGDRHANITTTLSCENTSKQHSRPIDSTWLRPGEYRRLGAIYTDEFTPPCTAELTWTEWDTYHLDKEVLYPLGTP